MTTDETQISRPALSDTSSVQRDEVFPLGTPDGAGPLIGWARGAKPAMESVAGASESPSAYVLTRPDGARFDGQASGFLVAATDRQIWLWAEGSLVVGREGTGPGGASADANGVVVLAFGLDDENRLALAYYKKIKHPQASAPGEMASLLVQLVRASPTLNQDKTDVNKALSSATDESLPTENPMSSVEEVRGMEPARDAMGLAAADMRPFPHAPSAAAEGALNGSVAGSAPRSGVSGALARLGQGLGLTTSGKKPMGSSGSHRSIRRHLRFAIAAMLLLAGGVGGWAATTSLSGAVIAMGQLVVDSNVKRIQHPFGGVIAELLVRDGDRVNADDVLIRLDGTETRASLAIVTKGLDELFARQARGQALLDGSPSVSFPPELTSRSADPAVANLIAGEQRLFDTMVAGMNGQKAQLREQISQLEDQVRGMQKQLDAKAKEIDWNAQELVGVRDLWEKKLVDFARVTTAERDGARLEGEHGMLLSSIAEAKGKIAELELRILQVGEEMRTEVGKEMAEMRSKIAELVEKKVAAEDQLERLEIRAPESGVVHQLAVHTIGGVIRPGDVVMGIVPDTDSLTAEVKVAPNEIDQVFMGQKAILRFLTFNQQTTPELNAELALISADVTLDEKTGASYYTARVHVPESEMSRLGGVKLIAGMPVEVFIQTNPRTVISYLTRPITDQIERSFRER